MPQLGWIIDEEQYTHAEALAYALTYPENFPFPPEVLAGMHQGKERGYVSPTMLSGCARQMWLRNTEDYFERPEQKWHAYRGTIAHLMMQAAAEYTPGAIVEKRRRRQIVTEAGPISIEGTPDLVLPGERLLRDYKTVRKFERPPANPRTTREWQPKSSWVSQASCYIWLMAGEHEYFDAELAQWQPSAPIPIAAQHIVQIAMEGVYVLPLTPFLWDLETTEAWIRARAPLFASAINGSMTEDALPPVLDPLFDNNAYLCKDWCPVATRCRELAAKGK